MDSKNPRQTIDNNFSYHAPNEEQRLAYEKLREAAKDVAILIADYCPEGREKSLAMTHLENAVMWANAAIARNQSDFNARQEAARCTHD
jgi:hypothetical protein